MKAVKWVSIVALAIGSLSPLAAADEYNIDSGHSSILFKAKRQGVVNVYGRFNQVEGKVIFDADNPGASSINLTIATESVDSNNERRDNHLKSPDFFNAEQFAEIVFKSTSVKKAEPDRYSIEGELSMHGVTKTITAEAVFTGAGENARRGSKSVGFETQFVVKRSEFGMNFMQGALSDDIEITFALHGVHRPAQ